ncbi:MAG: LysM peptidoglycan-binding domain-containing protein [Oscillospiraceae bacterium]|nr:LysM peptidoglycan-binding domain-containing protein [Oscillospiraceae bacterium]
MTIHVVQRGESLFAIARRYGVTAAELTYANQLQSPGTLAVGQALVIPADEVLHTVRRGESVYSIARSFGVSPAAVQMANPGAGGRIYPGQTLRIPFPNDNLGSMLVNGYVSSSTEQRLRQTLPYLSFLSPSFFRLDAAGELTREFYLDPDLSAEYNTANLLTVANTRPDGGFSSAVAHALLTDQEVQDTFVEELLNLLEGGEWYGVNLDLEYVYQYDRASYNQFLRRLTELLHARGYLVITALAPKLRANQSGLLYEAHDYAFHGATADYVILMTYEWGYMYGPAMAVAPVNMVRRVLDYAVSEMPAGKILMGMPNYGYDWTLPFVQGSAARPLTNVGAVTLAGNVGAEIRFDAEAQSPWFNYVDSAGRRHEVWFEDARSLRAKYRLVDEYGLAGVSFWNLNSLFRTNFLVLESMFSVEKVL